MCTDAEKGPPSTHRGPVFSLGGADADDEPIWPSLAQARGCWPRPATPGSLEGATTQVQKNAPCRPCKTALSTTQLRAHRTSSLRLTAVHGQTVPLRLPEVLGGTLARAPAGWPREATVPHGRSLHMAQERASWGRPCCGLHSDADSHLGPEKLPVPLTRSRVAGHLAGRAVPELRVLWVLCSLSPRPATESAHRETSCSPSEWTKASQVAEGHRHYCII